MVVNKSVTAAGAVTGSAPTGGNVTSDRAGVPGAIDCGTGGTLCKADFAWNSGDVLLRATKPVGATVMWAGACAGMDATCRLSGNADKAIYVRFFAAGEQPTHPNFSDGKVHSDAYEQRAANGLDCFRCHGDRLQGAGIAIGCNGCHATPAFPEPVLATIAFNPAAPLTGLVGQPVGLSALASDPGGAAVTCNWSFVSKPAASAVSLATAGACSGTPGAASFTPDLAGTYVVRVDSRVGRAEVSIQVAAQQFGGGALGAAEPAAGAELTAVATQLGKASAQHGGWMTAANLAKSLLGLDGTNPRGTYLLVDVRDPEDFARSHAPGAVNVPFAQLPAVLLANPKFPQAADTAVGSLKKLAVLGYYGGDGIQASLLFTAARLGAVGESATLAANQKTWGVQFGQTSWSFDKGGAPCRYDDDLSLRKLELVPEPQAAWPTTTNTSWLVKPPAATAYAAPAATNDFTGITAFTGNPSATQKILVRAKHYIDWLEQDATAKGVPRQERFQADWVRYDAAVRASAAPQILSVQSAAQWQAGHAKGAILTTAGAINGSASVAAALAFVKQLDPSKEVWIHCFTGTSAAAPAAVLGILGYKARNILYGNAGYTRDTTTGANAAIFDYDKTAFANDFALSKGASPGCDLLSGASSCAAYAPARNGCKECHANYSAHFAELTVKPIPGAVIEVASEGEG